MCTGRVDLGFMLRAFKNGKDGVFIGGCWPGECHYITEGNYLAYGTLQLCRKVLAMIGVNPERLRLEWISASEGSRYADVMNDFSTKLKELGPLGQGEGLGQKQLTQKLETLQTLVPYIKLVERERLRVPLKSVKAYDEFFSSDAFDRLFKDLIADKLEICQIMALLREKPYSAGELSQLVGLTPSAISRHLNLAARQGLGLYEEKQNLVAAVFEKVDSGRPGGYLPLHSEALKNAKIDQIIDAHQGKPGALIHVLMEIQSENHWLPKEILSRISRSWKCR